jgi:hypothetical protein
MPACSHYGFKNHMQFRDPSLRWHPHVRPLHSPLYFLCLRADPLGFEDPPPGIPVAAWTLCCLDVIAATAHFLRCAYPPRSRHPAHACSTPSFVDCIAAMGSLANISLSPLLSWILLLQPPGCCLSPTFPVVVPRCLVCLALGTRSVMTRFPFLVYMPCPSRDLLLMLRRLTSGPG